MKISNTITNIKFPNKHMANIAIMIAVLETLSLMPSLEKALITAMVQDLLFDY